MKAISVHQPHASKIGRGEKPVEYRSWQTKYRGDLIICASKSPRITGLPTGCTICIVDLHDITGVPGYYLWHLRNIRPLPPVPVRGKQRFFDLNIEGMP